MLMVVFGAGASYDSFSAGTPESGAWMNERPPLANGLFDLRFAYAIDQFPQCRPLMRHLRADVGQAAPNVEQVLEKFQSQADGDRERHAQLAAIRYYLQTVIWNCQTNWERHTNGATNYTTLVDQIRHYRDPKEKVCLVTFNYDTLLERALALIHVKTDTISDYIASDYQVIKLHGSMNWAHEVENDVRKIDQRSQGDIVKELIENARLLRFRQPYRTIGEYPIGRSNDSPWVPLFPALTIPIENKSQYECPQEHSETMERNLPHISRMLLIGWHASEKRFLDTLADSIRKDTEIMIISRNETSALHLIGQVKGAGVSGHFQTAKSGFSNSIRDGGEVEDFLQTSL